MMWSPVIETITPYTPGEQPKEGERYIKLNTNENPYPPSPKVLEAIQATANAQLRLYPDPDAYKLKQAIAEKHGVFPKNIFVGNGSDEVLALSFMAFFQKKKPLLFPDVSYSFYKVYAELFGIQVKTIPLKEDYTIDFTEYNNGEKAGIIFPNPNAPTGLAVSNKQIARLAASNSDVPIVVDEAYADFADESAVELINEYSNLLSVFTLSKSRALAGLRVGYAVGSENLIEGLERTKHSFNSYTLDRLAIEGATAAIKDEAYFKSITKRIIETREEVIERLKDLGFHVLPSKSNFIFTEHSDIPAERIFTLLKEKGILVRYFNKPRIDNFLRITIGKPEEMYVLLDALEEIIGQ